MSSTVLVTGPKSGIRKGLLASYVARPDTTAFTAIRDGPDSAAAKELSALPVGKGSKIIVFKYDARSASAASAVASMLKFEYNVGHLNVVVANAGILTSVPQQKPLPETIMEYLQINTLASIFLYQATHTS